MLALPFTDAAHQLGDARACNMVMLGAVLECTQSLPTVSVDAALRRLVKHARWIELDERAIEQGRALYRESQQSVDREMVALSVG